MRKIQWKYHLKGERKFKKFVLKELVHVSFLVDNSFKSLWHHIATLDFQQLQDGRIKICCILYSLQLSTPVMRYFGCQLTSV